MNANIRDIREGRRTRGDDHTRINSHELYGAGKFICLLSDRFSIACKRKYFKIKIIPLAEWANVLAFML